MAAGHGAAARLYSIIVPCSGRSFNQTKRAFHFFNRVFHSAAVKRGGFHGVFHLFHRVFHNRGRVFPIRNVMLCGSFWIFLEFRGWMFCFFQKNDDEKISIFFQLPRPARRDSPIWNMYAGGVFNIPRPGSSTVENFVHKRPKIRAGSLAAVCAALCPTIRIGCLLTPGPSHIIIHSRQNPISCGK